MTELSDPTNEKVRFKTPFLVLCFLFAFIPVAMFVLAWATVPSFVIPAYNHPVFRLGFIALFLIHWLFCIVFLVSILLKWRLGMRITLLVVAAMSTTFLSTTPISGGGILTSIQALQMLRQSSPN